MRIARNAGKTIHHAVAGSAYGPMLVAASEDGICRLSFGEDEQDLRRHFPKAELRGGDAAFDALVSRVQAVVAGEDDGADIPLDQHGTEFQQRVWAELRAIPAGRTRSYRDIAERLGNPQATRAVGGANGANGVAVLVPCHRVIAHDGTLGGYAYGAEMKRSLLAREGVMFAPAR
ncbi:methylated-DNA--[protein]-cysteine S-methyltransferase [Pseudopontixanthobacter vadosimaris]|uniref:methylated-DNA--[protein]-cysteine S-methyltransferase n=1 Tax=Pseudopontixanthobacter vadosimaris TaxID=2726450 RepID=UPI001472AA68|nr:methylated-DNA--[protein]-cysteine S-methyltransferase [Pseudopontixanthobacter vadosimaris]